MFERFTEKAIRVIMLAQEEARRLGHNFVGTEQVLLGLIGEGSGVAAKTLKSMGVNIKDARAQVEKIIGRGSGFVAVEIPFTPRAKKVLELTNQIITEDKLTALMITHNMQDAIRLGNRLMMLHKGRVLINLQTEEKKNLKVADLLKMFEKASGTGMTNDKMLLG